MNRTEIFDLNEYATSDINCSYYGKHYIEGITISGENWIVKYPKSSKANLLSEYIASKIFQILDIDCQETRLGIRNNSLVLACKNLCENKSSLREFRTVKNVYHPELSEQLKNASVSKNDLKAVLIHFEFNPILKSVPEIENHFWEQFIINVLIDNCQSLENFGVLYENGEYKISPVYSNETAFTKKSAVTKLNFSGKEISVEGIFKLENAKLSKTLEEIVPKIEDRFDEIKDFINQIPEQFGDFEICTKFKKQNYIKALRENLEHLLLPAYKENSC